jgi:pyruvate/2-oxoacid:ferredoxin oxidoreductase beta subunit
MMHTAEALRVFLAHRGDAIVVPGRGGRHWVKLSERQALDVPLGDPAMGGHAGFALGLALAQPARRVVLFDSEGDILMSLGMLAAIAEQAPANFYHFLLDNECYATTGGSRCRMRRAWRMTRSRAGWGIRGRLRLRRSERLWGRCRGYWAGRGRCSLH